MLNNKIVQVTGASAGIGRATALICAREGARIVVSDINEEAGEATAVLVREAGGDAIFVAADVGIPEHAKVLVDRAVTHYGRLDIACNNAGIGGPTGATADYPLDGCASHQYQPVAGVLWHAAADRCDVEDGGGAIVNVASVLGAVAFATSPAYTAAKHGVVGLTQAAALRNDYGWMAALGLLSADERMAAFLLHLSRRFSAQRFMLRMTRAEIGSFLGLTLETISRVFSRFQRLGLLRVTRREIELLDMATLQALAQSQALH